MYGKSFVVKISELVYFRLIVKKVVANKSCFIVFILFVLYLIMNWVIIVYVVNVFDIFVYYIIDEIFSIVFDMIFS